MAFVPKKQVFSSSVNTVTVGIGDQAVKLGGTNVLPFYSFDAPIENAPKIGVEITDRGLAAYPQAGLREFYAGCETVADMAKRAQTMRGVSFLCLHLDGADPNGENKSVEECVALAKQVAEATTLPLVIMGCKNIEKDSALFSALAEALQGRNILILSAREENYKSVRCVGIRTKNRCGIRRGYQPGKAAQRAAYAAWRCTLVHCDERGLRRCRLWL